MKYLGFAFLALFALLISITDASAVVCAANRSDVACCHNGLSPILASG